MIAGIEIRVSGQPLDTALMDRLVEVRVEDNLRLPDTFTVRISDPGLEHVDRHPLDVGADVELLLASSDGNRLVSLLQGQVTSVEPEFARDGVTIVARGYDHSHLLNRTKRSETYQNSTVGDVARKVAGRAGVGVGTIDDGGGVLDFTQQNNESDWEFLWRLADRVGNEVVVIDRTLHFRTAGGAATGAPRELRWGKELLSFRPRITGVQQVEDVVVRGWDAKAKKVIEATSRPERLLSTIGIARDSVVSALKGGTLTVADRPVTTQEEANALAASVAARVANAYLEAEGVCHGDPDLRAGTQVRVEGVGSRFSGTYTASATTHVFRGTRGYETRFQIGGQSSRSLLDLATPAIRKRWGNSVVIGVVTQNDDPDGLGRVRVKYPELGEDTEGWWARVATPGAGKDKGLLMLPVVGDEVVLAFEHDDIRKPYVLGSVWNGVEKPGDLVHTDGSLAVTSQEKMAVTVKKGTSITDEEEYVVQVGQCKVTLKKDGSVAIEGSTVKVTASGSLTVEGQGGLTLKGASVTIQASGMVQVSGSQISLG